MRDDVADRVAPERQRRPGDHPEMPRGAPAPSPAACAPGRGARGTSPSRPASPSRARSPRTRAGARPSAPSRGAGRRSAPACTPPGGGAGRATPPPPAVPRRSRLPSRGPAVGGAAGADARPCRGTCSTRGCRATSGTGPPPETGRCGCKAWRAPPGQRPPRPADPRAGTRPAAARPVRGARPTSPARDRRRPWRGPQAPDPTGLHTPAGHVPDLGGLDAPPPVWVAGTCSGYSSCMREGTLRPEVVRPLLRGALRAAVCLAGGVPVHPGAGPRPAGGRRRGLRGADGRDGAAAAGSGRARRGAGVLFSLSLRPETPPGRLPPLTLVVAEAVAVAAGPRRWCAGPTTSSPTDASWRACWPRCATGRRGPGSA